MKQLDIDELQEKRNRHNLLVNGFTILTVSMSAALTYLFIPEPLPVLIGAGLAGFGLQVFAQHRINTNEVNSSE